MQFYADLLSEILGESAASSNNLHLKQNAIEWPKMIVTDARDVYDRLSTEKGGLKVERSVQVRRSKCACIVEANESVWREFNLKIMKITLQERILVH